MCNSTSKPESGVKKKARSNMVDHMVRSFTLNVTPELVKLSESIAESVNQVTLRFRQLSPLDKYVQTHRKDLRLSYRPGLGGLVTQEPYFYFDSNNNRVPVYEEDVRLEYLIRRMLD